MWKRSAFVVVSLWATLAQASSPDFLRARVLFRTGQVGPALALAEATAKRTPNDADIWGLLGAIHLQRGDLDHAQSSLDRALALAPGAPQALYDQGVVFALRKRPDDAFVYLGRARAGRKLDMTAAQVDPHLATLRGDPRFAALLPTPADFAKPFVEPTQIVREWDGEAANDQFGWIARKLGDVDHDGVPDVVTSAPTHHEGAGRVYVFSTRSGKLLWTADGKPGEQLGTGVESAGDTDHDGVDDVIAGAVGSDTAYVYSGKDGHVLLTLHGDKGDGFGQHVSTAGDLDGDGHADVLVGAPNAKASQGRALAYSGKTGRPLLELTGERAGDQFGSTVSGRADGKIRFMVIGAPAGGPRKTGRVYVYDRLSPTPAFHFDADESGAALGLMFTAVLGDVDGDGTADVFASDFGDVARGPSTGRVYVYSGKTGRRIWALSGEGAGEGFGTTHSVTDDLDGDGHANLVVGSWQYAGAAISGGRVYLYDGRSGKQISTITCRIPGDTFGFDAIGMGDVDGDGISDLLVTSAWSGIHGFHSGRMFIISSGVRRARL